MCPPEPGPQRSHCIGGHTLHALQATGAAFAISGSPMTDPNACTPVARCGWDICCRAKQAFLADASCCQRWVNNYAQLADHAERGFADEASAEFAALAASVSEAQTAADTAQKEAESLQARGSLQYSVSGLALSMQPALVWLYICQLSAARRFASASQGPIRPHAADQDPPHGL